MSAQFVQHVLRENRPLFALIHRFNCQVAGDIHPEHFGDLLPEKTFAAVRGSRRGAKHLSRWAESHWQLDPAGVWDFAEPVFRLALLSPLHLLSLVRYLGSSVNSHLISQSIDRQRQTDFRQHLGEEIYHFATKRAAFLVRGLPLQALAPANPTDPAAILIDQTGKRCLEVCLGRASDELIRRLNLKLPTALSLQPASSLSSDDSAAVWNLAKRILVTEIAPELSPCFN